MSSRLHFLCLSSDLQIQARCQDLAAEFQYSFSQDEKAFDQIQFILVHAAHLAGPDEMAQYTAQIRHRHRDGFICSVVSEQTSQETMDLIKNSGVNLILNEKAFYETSRLEYLASQIIRGFYIPVKLSEFPKDSLLDFTLYHLLPLNQKLLPILPKGSPMTEDRLKKLESIGEVFVRRDELDRYRHYIDARPDAFSVGLHSRCRALYLSFCSAHAQLLFMLMDESENTSFKESKWLYDRCLILAQDLLVSLSSIGEAWEVVNNASLGEFGSVERAPTVAAYAGLLSFLSSTGEPVEVMMAALLSDVGMLEIRPAILKKIRASQNISSLSESEYQEYHEHPIISVNRCLSRNFPLTSEVQEIILCSHEKVDGTGFPDRKPGNEIPFEAMLIQFSELIDQGAMVKMGHVRKSVQEVRRHLVAQEMQQAQIFNLGFLTKLQTVI